MASDCNDCAIIFKAVSDSENEDDDLYSNVFRSANFIVSLVPVLDFEFTNLEELLIKLKNPNDYEGIIFSSPRCVKGVELSVFNDNITSILEKWQKHRHFVVGEKTAQLVEDLGFRANGKEAGNAKNLAEIMSKGQYAKPFLYPKGSLTKDTFKSALKENNIKVDDITIYKTKPHPELETHITNIKSCCVGKTFFFLYFSPSGVNFTLPLLKKHDFELNKIKFVAIGPSTEQAIKENGLKVATTSSKPDPHALLNAVLSFKADGKHEQEDKENSRRQKAGGTLHFLTLYEVY